MSEHNSPRKPKPLKSTEAKKQRPSTPSANPKSSDPNLLTLPLLPLQKVALFPGVGTDVLFGRPGSIATLDALQDNLIQKKIAIATQVGAILDDKVTQERLHPHVCIGVVTKFEKVQEGYQINLIGTERASLLSLKQTAKSGFSAKVKLLPERKLKSADSESELRQFCLLIKERFEELNEFLEVVPEDKLETLLSIDVTPSLYIDRISYVAPFGIKNKIRLLAERSSLKRAKLCLQLIEEESAHFQEVRNLHQETKNRIEKVQHEYFLREQLRSIQGQLRDSESEEEDSENGKLLGRIRRCKAPKAVLEKVKEEFGRMEKIPPMSPEGYIVQSYIKAVLDMPWGKKDKINQDLKQAQESLDKAHYGLEEVKEAVVEQLAVQILSKHQPRSILCLVGMPGVGKTSIASSIAKATGRNFQRIALGGLRDEAELRGHRKTYIGAMPGRIVQKIKTAGVKNPLILLDEIDKLGYGIHGDPAAALLEILDPEQNRHFQDNYLEVEFDLSEVMFVCTANDMYSIPEPLLDRMEVIRLPGYLGDEKREILHRHLLPKQLKLAGMGPEDLTLTKEAEDSLLFQYTTEAGVRQLERTIIRLIRKLARERLEKKTKGKWQLTLKDIERYLGPPIYHLESKQKYLIDAVGQVNALAWTQVGGETLRIEVLSVPGQGKLQSTGRLGKVMQESAETVWSCVKSRLYQHLPKDAQKRLEQQNWHLHVLDGATPKDGPSAGCAIATALISAVLGIKVKGSVAMTGELSLTGHVMPIGGLREKVYAAISADIETVLFPFENLPQWEDLPKKLKEKIRGIPCSHIEEIWSYALETSKKTQKLVEKP